MKNTSREYSEEYPPFKVGLKHKIIKKNKENQQIKVQLVNDKALVLVFSLW